MGFGGNPEENTGSYWERVPSEAWLRVPQPLQWEGAGPLLLTMRVKKLYTMDQFKKKHTSQRDHTIF